MVVKFIISPICFILGIFGHGLCLIAFYNQYKKDNAYVHQIFVTSANALYIIVHGLYVLNVYLAFGILVTPPPFLSSCYECMWVFYRLGVFLDITCTTMVQFFSLFTGTDRFLALRKGTAYKSTSKRTHVLVAIICITFSILINIGNSFLLCHPILLSRLTAPILANSF